MLGTRRAVLTAFSATLLAATLLTACANPTQLIVMIDSDVSDVAVVTLDVRYAGRVEGRRFLVGSEVSLPFSLTLTPSGEPAAQRQIEVNAFPSDRSAGALVTSVTTTHFLSERRLVLPIFLSAACTSVSCGADETCERGRCVSASVDPEDLEDFGRADAGADPTDVMGDTGDGDTVDGDAIDGDTIDGDTRDAGVEDTRPDVRDADACVASSNEDSPALCADGCDNDRDGLSDCDDFGCEGVPACRAMACDTLTEREDTSPSGCTDGCDNDGNGFVDCEDFVCRGTRDCGVEFSNKACADGLDNDDNGLIDCADPSCNGTGARVGMSVCVRDNSNVACSDGLDNDGNGFVDCADRGCQGEHIVVCGGEVPPRALWTSLVNARCTDGENNDAATEPPGERLTDCGDLDCARSFEATACHDLLPESDNASCRDGIDNDRNGAVDCDDLRCQREGVVVCNGSIPVSLTASEIRPRMNVVCGDGVDNDGNGFTDCADFGCSQDPFQTVCGATERDDAACADGIDNDGNGFTDCADFACSLNLRVTVCPRELTVAECSDGIDNDGNSYADCFDRSCRSAEVTRSSPACQ